MLLLKLNLTDESLALLGNTVAVTVLDLPTSIEEALSLKVTDSTATGLVISVSVFFIVYVLVNNFIELE